MSTVGVLQEAKQYALENGFDCKYFWPRQDGGQSVCMIGTVFQAAKLPFIQTEGIFARVIDPDTNGLVQRHSEIIRYMLSDEHRLALEYLDRVTEEEYARATQAELMAVGCSTCEVIKAFFLSTPGKIAEGWSFLYGRDMDRVLNVFDRAIALAQEMEVNGSDNGRESTEDQEGIGKTLVGSGAISG